MIMLKYVYEHWYNNQCFYVGCGTLKRTKDLRKTHRNEKYWEFCNYDRKNIKIKIIKEFEDEIEAHEFEKALTIYHDYILKSPLTNINTGTSVGVESARKTSSTKMGHKVSEETKKKISKSKKGTQSWNSKEICAINKDKKIYFKSLKKCADYFEERNLFTYGQIQFHVKGKTCKAIEDSDWDFLVVKN